MNISRYVYSDERLLTQAGGKVMIGKGTGLMQTILINFVELKWVY